jgi:hypothetical protein
MEQKPVVARCGPDTTKTCEIDALKTLTVLQFTASPPQELTGRQMRANLFRLFNLIRKGISPASARRLVYGFELLLRFYSAPDDPLMQELGGQLLALKAIAAECKTRDDLRQRAALLREKMPSYLGMIEQLEREMTQTRLDGMAEYVKRYTWDEDFLPESFPDIIMAESRLRNAVTNATSREEIARQVFDLCRLVRNASVLKFDADTKQTSRPRLDRDSLRVLTDQMADMYGQYGIVPLTVCVSDLLDWFQKETAPPKGVTAEEFTTLIRCIASLDAAINNEEADAEISRWLSEAIDGIPSNSSEALPNDQPMDQPMDESTDQAEEPMDAADMPTAEKPVITYYRIKDLYTKLVANQTVCHSLLMAAFAAEIQDRLAKSRYADSKTMRFMRFTRRLDCYRKACLSEGNPDEDDYAVADADFVLYTPKGFRRITYLSEVMGSYFAETTVAELDTSSLYPLLRRLADCTCNYTMNHDVISRVSMRMEGVETLHRFINAADFEMFIDKLRQFEYDLSEGTWLFCRTTAKLIATVGGRFPVRHYAQGPPTHNREWLRAQTVAFIDAYNVPEKPGLVYDRFNELWGYVRSCTTDDLRFDRFVRTLMEIEFNIPIKGPGRQAAISIRRNTLMKYFTLSTDVIHLKRAALVARFKPLLQNRTSAMALRRVACDLVAFLENVSSLDNNVELGRHEFYKLIDHLRTLCIVADGTRMTYRARVMLNAIRQAYFRWECPEIDTVAKPPEIDTVAKPPEIDTVAEPPKHQLLQSKFNAIMRDKFRVIETNYRTGKLGNSELAHFADRVYFFAKGALVENAANPRLEMINHYLGKFVEYLHSGRFVSEIVENYICELKALFEVDTGDSYIRTLMNTQ